MGLTVTMDRQPPDPVTGRPLWTPEPTAATWRDLGPCPRPRRGTGRVLLLVTRFGMETPYTDVLVTKLVGQFNNGAISARDWAGATREGPLIFKICLIQ